MRTLVVALAAVLALSACSAGKDAVQSGTEFEFVSPGGKTDLTYTGDERKPITQFSGESLLEEGKQVSLADFPGQVVVLNFWGAWCPPCRVEAPQLQQVYDQTKAQGVVVLGVDLRDHARSLPQDFVRDQKLTYPSIYDPSGRSLLGLKGYPRNTVPSTIVLDREHRVAAVFLRDLLATDLLPVVRQLAAEK